MNVLSPINIEAALVILVSDAVLDLGPEHHLAALHVVVHHVLELRLQGLLVYFVEEDLLLGDDLDADVILDEENLPSLLDALVLLPLLVTCFRVLLDLEEEDHVRATDDQGLVENQVHLTHGQVTLALHDLFIILVFRNVVSLDDKVLRLTINCVDLIGVRIEEAFDREVSA